MTAKTVDDKAKTVAARGVTIVDFGGLTEAQLSSAANVLREALAHMPSGYRAAGVAEAEVAARREASDWVGCAALQGERLVGWIGAIKTYEHGWEIHPLVVAPDRQRHGIGSPLLEHLKHEPGAKALSRCSLAATMTTAEQACSTSTSGPTCCHGQPRCKQRNADTLSRSIVDTAMPSSACCLM